MREQGAYAAAPAARKIALASSITDSGAEPSALLLMVTKAR